MSQCFWLFSVIHGYPSQSGVSPVLPARAGRQVPDHSTFSKNRHGRFRESDALRRLFESVVQRCMAEGLVGAEGFAVDASLIAADASKQRSVPSKDWSLTSAPQAALLPQRRSPQGSKAHSRGRPGRGARSRFNA
jgi:hypothetical protein